MAKTGSAHVGVRQRMASEDRLQAVSDPEAKPLLVDASAARWETLESEQLSDRHDSGMWYSFPLDCWKHEKKSSGGLWWLSVLSVGVIVFCISLCLPLPLYINYRIYYV